MKILKSVLVVLWVVSTTLFIVGSLTPLEFRSKVVAYASFVIAFNGAFAMPFLLSSYIRLKIKWVIIGLALSTTMALTYYFMPLADANWKTQEVLYRKKDNHTTVIAFQMIQNGNLQFDHRIVKMTRVTPFFDWIVELNNFKPSDNWEKVDEYINELGLDQPNKRQE